MKKIITVPITSLKHWALITITTGFLSACGGSNDGANRRAAAANPMPPASYSQVDVATGTLAAGVRVLSDAENAQLTNQTAKIVTFNGTIDFTPGQIVMGQETVFKVVSSTALNDRTDVVVTDPSVEDVFENLQIKGSFSGQIEPIAETNITPKAASTSLPQLLPLLVTSKSSWPFTISAGALSASETLAITRDCY